MLLHLATVLHQALGDNFSMRLFGVFLGTCVSVRHRCAILLWNAASSILTAVAKKKYSCLRLHIKRSSLQNQTTPKKSLAIVFLSMLHIKRSSLRIRNMLEIPRPYGSFIALVVKSLIRY